MLAPPIPGSAQLRGEGVTVRFGGVCAVDNVSIALEQHAILGLIGPNGAGKTTLVNALTGFQRLTGGRVTLNEADVTGWPAHRLGKAGVARTFQGVRIFRDLTVSENIEVAALAVASSRRAARRVSADLLTRFGLGDRAGDRGGNLPHGAARKLGIARAVAVEPTFLLLDEPAAGLNEGETRELASVLRSLVGDLRVALLVIEHDMTLIMKLCDEIQVLDHGRTIARGAPSAIQRDPAVIEAYLGTDDTQGD